MPISHIDHFTLRTSKVEETAAFFRDALGMEEGWRPNFPFPGRWLYIGDRPIVHLADFGDSKLNAYLGTSAGGRGSGALDHIALRCTGLQEYQSRLAGLGLEFFERIVPELGEHQMFVQDPNGLKVELIFPYSPDNKPYDAK